MIYSKIGRWEIYKAWEDSNQQKELLQKGFQPFAVMGKTEKPALIWFRREIIIKELLNEINQKESNRD